MKTRSLFTLGLLGCFAGIGFLGLLSSRVLAATIQELNTGAERAVIMENEFVRLKVDLAHGARVTSYLYKPTGREWAAGLGQGLFADHVWQQSWPGELYNARYDYQIIERGPSNVSVRVWRCLEQAVMNKVAGVRVDRTLMLADGSPLVTAEVKLSNPTDQLKSVGYWPQHIFQLGGTADNYYIRPGVSGLAIGLWESRGSVKNKAGDEWVKDPAAGWTAVICPATGEAAAFLMDYNDLRWLYNCLESYTTEWYYDLVRLPPSRSWTTTIMLLPLRGYTGISFASREIIADVHLRRAAGGFHVVFTVGCGESPLSNVSMRAELLAPQKTNALGAAETVFDVLDYQPREFASPLVVPEKGAPFLVKVTVAGAGFTHRFEKHFGDYNRSDKLIAGNGDTGYVLKPPEKLKRLARADAFRKIPHQGINVFEARGQFYPAWKLGEALKLLGPFTIRPGHYGRNVYGEQLDDFPVDGEDIMKLDAVILNNVPAEALGANDMALLKGFVNAGGGLLVLGGWYAFGGGGYAESALADMLPVESGKMFDIRRCRKGLPVQCRGGLFTTVQFADRPEVQWLQEVPHLRTNAQVVMTAGGEPLVVLGTYGQGRVACILASPTGVASPDGTLFCESAQWPAVMARLLGWLKGKGSEGFK